MTDKRNYRRTKIVATLGPGTSDRGAIAALCGAGVNVFRVNSSHGTPESRARLMDLVREVREECDPHAALLLDLQGPRIRVGELSGPLILKAGQEVVFAPDDDTSVGEIPTTYHALAQDVAEGSRILLDDGLLTTEVTSVSGSRVGARVIHGGILNSHKGMNLPGVKVSAPSVTEKDKGDIALGLEHHVDYIGISFVRNADDVRSVRSLVPDTVRLVAKIEKDEALEQIEAIVDAADAVMVARGDLGVELPFEEVPLAQKMVIKTANRLGKAVITATQMLESMVGAPRPTRAEASDVANAILDGTDAVMLSAETAVGEYPVHAVRAMARIIDEIEKPDRRGSKRRRRADYRQGEVVGVGEAIAVATCAAAEMLEVPFIVCFTKSGYTATKVSSLRPTMRILALSTEQSTCRHLSLVWGVTSRLAPESGEYSRMVAGAKSVLESEGWAGSGDRFVVTAGVPFDVPGTTNLLKVEVV